MAWYSPMDETICSTCKANNPHHTHCMHRLAITLPVVTKTEVATTSEHEIALRQTEALTVLAEGVKTIANFLQGGGLTQVLGGYARSQAVKDILGGLASHDGRNSLDARLLTQNATEIVHAVEAVFEKYQEKLKDKSEKDPEIKASQPDDYRKWLVQKGFEK